MYDFNSAITMYLGFSFYRIALFAGLLCLYTPPVQIWLIHLDALMHSQTLMNEYQPRLSSY